MRVLLLTAALGLLLSTTSAHPFVLLEKWKDQYLPMYQNTKTREYSFDSEFGGNPEYELVVHTVVNHSFVDQGWDYVYFRPTDTMLDNRLWDSYHAVGFAEGYLTHLNISEQLNAVPPLSPAVSNWTDQQISFMEAKINNNSNANSSEMEKSFWHRVDCLFAQMTGMAAGYNSRLTKDGVNPIEFPSITVKQLYILNFLKEVQDVEFALSDPSKPAPLRTRRDGATMFIKVTNYDLYVGHNTIAEYSTMRRQYKSYCMDTSVSLSSYPGKIGSGDDWIITNTQLAIQSAPLYVWDMELYRSSTLVEAVPQFLRILIGAYQGSSNKQFGALLEMYNSGTGNAQYHVVAMSQFRGSKIRSSLLYQVEQIPGLTVQADLTANLTAQGYWLSVDVPVFTANISEPAGYNTQERVDERIWGLTGNTNPRIHVVENLLEAEQVVDPTGNSFNMDSFQRIMRSNSNGTSSGSEIPDCVGTTGGRCDPANSAMFAVAPRGDLNPSGSEKQYGPAVEWIGRVPRGAIDTKIITHSNLKYALDGLVMAGLVISGPTSEVNGARSAFDWGPFKSDKPKDLPVKYNFTWLRYTVPYPPHGYYDGYPDIGPIIGAIIGTTLAAAVIGTVLVKVVLGKGEREEVAGELQSETVSLLNHEQKI